MAHSNSMSPHSLECKVLFEPSDRFFFQAFLANAHYTFWSTGYVQHHPQPSELTTRWCSVDSTVPLFTRVFKTFSCRSEDMTTKSMIDLRPRVPWCHVQLWRHTFVKHGVHNRQTIKSTEVRKQNTVQVQSREVIFPKHVPSGH